MSLTAQQTNAQTGVYICPFRWSLTLYLKTSLLILVPFVYITSIAAKNINGRSANNYPYSLLAVRKDDVDRNAAAKKFNLITVYLTFARHQ